MGPRLSADVVAPWPVVRPWISRALGAAPLGPSVLLRARELDSHCPCSSCGQPCTRWSSVGRSDGCCKTPRTREEIIERVAALDIGKAELVCCVRVPEPGRRRAADAGGDHLLDDDPVVAGDGRPAPRVGGDPGGDGGNQRLLEAAVLPVGGAGFETWLVNAKDVKHLPGRPKTDRLDAVWLCKVAERQMLRPSFVPPEPIRRLRDLTRYRVALVAEVGAEKNRVEKLLEDAQIKLSVVASDIFGVSGRAMMAALVAGHATRRRSRSWPGTPRTRIPSHPRTRRLTHTHEPQISSSLRSAGSCRLPGHPPFSVQAGYCVGALGDALAESVSTVTSRSEAPVIATASLRFVRVQPVRSFLASISTPVDRAMVCSVCMFVGCVLSPPLTSTVVVAALLHRPSQPRRASSESEEHCRDDDHPPPGLHDSGEG